MSKFDAAIHTHGHTHTSRSAFLVPERKCCLFHHNFSGLLLLFYILALVSRVRVETINEIKINFSDVFHFQ